ncbi:radical SAM protein [candidate division KSB3 bacterium]|uniref:Radical SAM protein n=1 Tax=candidate division KSB3 bacterium TaxID=2044937 RepID=A0A9D5K153_9BACT|nr:radical SAM protein [candidate division KSB3 bacterium]MBD3327605.1 radical SAM protein [candidate division KSB3 bacterium]
MEYRRRQAIEATLHGERGTVYKAHDTKIRIALIYPNTYYVGMSNLGVHTIYGLLNAHDDVYCERVFFPDANMLPYYQRTKTPLCSLESQTALAEFDILAFSVSFENDYLNILHLLEFGRIPATTEERQDSYPVVMLGGAVTAINPEPLAVFIDVFIIGEGEEILADVLETYRHAAGKRSKRTLVERLAQIPGVYVPSLYDITYTSDGRLKHRIPRANAPAHIKTRPLLNLDCYPAYSRILTEQTEFGKMFLLQLNRGCGYACRFCHTGYAHSPLRHLSLEAALRLIRQGLQVRERIGLVGAAIADYPQLPELAEAICSQGGKLSVSSLRLSALAKRPDLLDILLQTDQKTITIAPEAGTERLRRLISKALTDTVLYDTLEHILRKHLVHLKLYFLIGLPTETDEDIEAIIHLCQQCRQLLRNAAKTHGKIGKMTVSVSPLVPKPFTPLQWHPMAPENVLKRKLHHIKRQVSRLGNLQMSHTPAKSAIWQGILARGDRRLGHILLRTAANGGNWKRAFRELNMRPEFYVHRPRDKEEQLPWSHLHVGLSHHRLHDEYQRMLAMGSQ